MNHKRGIDRNQMYMSSLESSIGEDAFVRVVDAFVDALDLESFGFANMECQEAGRPPYHPSVLLKLYLYGYRYGIRSCRKLERESRTNIEAMWLLNGLYPKYKTIADFRKNHPQAFRAVFRKFVWMLKQWNLVEGKTIAIDSFKIRGDNSIKNNFNEKKIARHLTYIEKQINEYEAQLDASEDSVEKETLNEKIHNRKQTHAKYDRISKELDESGQEQISTTDPDALAIKGSGNEVKVGYNIQAASDKKHKFLIDYDTGHVTDRRALADLAISSKDILQAEEISVLADKGYHSGEQLNKCKENNITTYVAPLDQSNRKPGLYPVTAFRYNPEKDVYTCPDGQFLTSNQKWYKTTNGGTRYRRYRTSACTKCQNRSLCTSSKRDGRYIDRSEYAEAIEENAQRIDQNPEYYKQRQQITEHMFGTLQRQRGFDYTLLRGKEKVLGEVGLAFIAYNLSRCISVMGTKNLIKVLKECALSVFDRFKKSYISNHRLFSVEYQRLYKYKLKNIDSVRSVLVYHTDQLLRQNVNYCTV